MVRSVLNLFLLALRLDARTLSLSLVLFAQTQRRASALMILNLVDVNSISSSLSSLRLANVACERMVQPAGVKAVWMAA